MDDVIDRILLQLEMIERKLDILISVIADEADGITDELLFDLDGHNYGGERDLTKEL